MKPVATVKPTPRDENTPFNLLGDILNSQNETMKPCITSTIVPVVKAKKVDEASEVSNKTENSFIH
jgi:hypothetical protein